MSPLLKLIINIFISSSRGPLCVMIAENFWHHIHYWSTAHDTAWSLNTTTHERSGVHTAVTQCCWTTHERSAFTLQSRCATGLGQRQGSQYMVKKKKFNCFFIFTFLSANGASSLNGSVGSLRKKMAQCFESKPSFESIWLSCWNLTQLFALDSVLTQPQKFGIPL